ncbi:nuclear envelope pore membrane protein POM 121-like [Manis javanica]|uniref:nuclear envelope pore membrane protein POM 121-like n=1 Tax=Manis javanica TaxID=9974 RepID=UPI003C6D50A1
MLCQNGNGSHRKHVLSPGNSRVECRPSTVRITPPGSKLAHFPIAAQIHNAPDLWSKEAVLHALEHWKMKRRTVEGEEDQSSAAAQEEKRRTHHVPEPTPGTVDRAVSKTKVSWDLGNQ